MTEMATRPVCAVWPRRDEGKIQATDACDDGSSELRTMNFYTEPLLCARCTDVICGRNRARTTPTWWL
ncbi:hypothetical protein DPEC_G00089760 [Dallia pectoralis]|uniref:Uncharacterized protein n=1 Tax=Dallia pectoralis TaxID=75939 RepID=A0ACC2H0G1_DALPE|nr:hypothetical protein DPEC_G00089760 [Dallia pectoralis]